MIIYPYSDQDTRNHLFKNYPPKKKRDVVFLRTAVTVKQCMDKKLRWLHQKKNCSCLFSDQTMKFTEFFGGLLLNGPSLILTA